MQLLRLAFILMLIPVAGGAIAQSVLPETTDTLAIIMPNDTANGTVITEDQYQNSVDSLYQEIFSTLDTFAWDNIRINSGRFNSAAMTDTIRISMCDSLWTERFVFPTQNKITHDFGKERYGWHYGIDIRVATGDTILAAMDGVVRLTKYDKRGFGRVIVIRHAQGLETIYGHLSKALVQANQPVRAGEAVGLAGNSGRSTGPHLHFEVRFLGEPLNPHDFMDFNDFQMKCDTLTLTKANFEYLVELRKAKYYTIKSGDTLSGIAVKYHTSVSKLCALNGISSKTTLRIGRKIRYQ